MRNICSLMMLVVAFGCNQSGVPPVADAGPLDPAFGTNGFTLTDFDCPASVSVLALVKTRTGWVTGGTACRAWALAGYTPDGKADPGFGTGGRSVFFAQTSPNLLIRHLAVRDDGRIVAAGDSPTRSLLRQFSATGKQDVEFGATVDAVISPHFPLTFTFALQPDGKAVIALREIVLRIDADGQRDLGFGDRGVSTVSLFGPDTFVEQVRIRPDGAIVLIGTRPSAPERPKPFIALLTPTGQLDATFGTLGTFELPVPAGGEIRLAGATVQYDNAIVLSGSDFQNTTNFTGPVLWRLTAAGALDAAFGVNGRAAGSPTQQGGGFNALAALEDGRLVAAGFDRSGSGRDLWVVARFTSNGKLDPAFGVDGTVRFDVGVRSLSGGAAALAVSAEGYVMAGRGNPSDEFGGGAFGLARVRP